MSENLKQKKELNGEEAVVVTETENNEIIICPYCQKVIGKEDNLKICPNCGVPHHLECWNQHNGCSTFSCSQIRQISTKIVCKKCGNECDATQRFCPSCGIEISNMNDNLCTNCGAKIPESQHYCPSCGKKKEESKPLNMDGYSANSTITVSNGGGANKNLIVGIFIGLFVIVIVLFFVFKGCQLNGPNLKAVYDKYCSSEWAELASDGSYLKVDTNPYNEDEDDMSYSELGEDIRRSDIIKNSINKELNLPKSLGEKMGSTRALDGRQSETFDNIEVSWTYHPNQGLEVIYSKKK